jgi:hypothetical protein
MGGSHLDLGNGGSRKGIITRRSVVRKVWKGNLEFGKEGELLAGRERVYCIWIVAMAATHRGCSRGAFLREACHGLPLLRRPGEQAAMQTRSVSQRSWRLVDLGHIDRLMWL